MNKMESKVERIFSVIVGSNNIDFSIIKSEEELLNLEDNFEDDDYKSSFDNFLLKKYGVVSIDKLLNDDMLYKMNLEGAKGNMGLKNRTFYQELYVPLRLKSISKPRRPTQL